MQIIGLISAGIPVVLQIAVAVIFIRRGLYRRSQFPFFFSYTVYSIVAEILRQSVHGRLYSPLYWGTEFFYGLLALLALQEAFRWVFSLSYEDDWWFRLILPTVMLPIASLCLWGVVYYPLHNGPALLPSVLNAIWWFDLGVHFLKGCIWPLALVLAKIFHVSIARHEQGILAGFAISACFTLIAYLAWFDFGAPFVVFLRFAPPVGYILAAAVWLFTFVPSPPPRQRVDAGMARAIADWLAKELEMLKEFAKKFHLRERQAGL
jgi:hypothetical protein